MLEQVNHVVLVQVNYAAPEQVNHVVLVQVNHAALEQVNIDV